MRSLSLALALGFAVASSVSLAGEPASAIALSIDNDLFAPTRTDRDYTAGVAITYSSNSEALNNSLVSRAVGATDRTAAWCICPRAAAISQPVAPRDGPPR